MTWKKRFRHKFEEGKSCERLRLREESVKISKARVVLKLLYCEELLFCSFYTQKLTRG